VASAQDLDVEDHRAKEAKLNEVQIFNARRNARLGETEVLEQRIDQLQSQIKGLKALIASKRELRASFREEIKDLDALLAEGFVDKVRLRSMERSLSRTESKISHH